ncbi:MAG TPA: cytochrome c [Kofleriaceae bacterium]|nr:cytochrome c [Kofleriaceae bacterium]
MRWFALVLAVSCSAPAKQPVVAVAAPIPTDAAAPDAAPDAAPPIPDGDLANAKLLFDQRACSSCHTLNGSVRVGPSWLGLWGTDEKLEDGRVAHVDAAYVRKSIVDPLADIVAGYPHAMPSYAQALSDQEIDDLVTLIYSLRSQ